nr:TIGR00296 family protein [Candidatus Njordarchaeum guaymaensis]
MVFSLSPADGEFLVKLARKTMQTFVTSRNRVPVPPETPSKLMTKCGVFVTLEKMASYSQERELRGCIGRPLPDIPLVEATIESAIDSCSEDPRFLPVRPSELQEIIVEVSVLTPPELITVDDPKNYPKKIKVGVHGLLVERGWNKGLLLPQVPVEWGWNEEEFIAQCCIKAGLPTSEWLKKTTKIYKFEGLVFQELEPNGQVVQRDLTSEKEK